MQTGIMVMQSDVADFKKAVVRTDTNTQMPRRVETET